MTSTQSLRTAQAGRRPRGGGLPRPRRAGLRALPVVPALVVVIVALIIPVVILLSQSFFDPDFTLDNYTKLFADETSMTVLGRTLGMSAIVTVVTLLLAYPYAAAMTMVSDKTRAIMLAIVLLPFWTSLMARTFAWIVLLQENGPVSALLSVVGLGDIKLGGTAIGVVIGMTQVLLPFMVLPLYSVLSTIDLRLVTAAQSLGARPLVAFAKVYLPLSMPGIFAGITLVFIMSIGFYVTPALLGSPREAMVAQLIDTRIIRMLDFAGGGALALVLIAIILVLLLIVTRFVGLSQALGAGATKR